jgi:hypothetical protein
MRKTAMEKRGRASALDYAYLVFNESRKLNPEALSNEFAMARFAIEARNEAMEKYGIRIALICDDSGMWGFA